MNVIYKKMVSMLGIILILSAVVLSSTMVASASGRVRIRHAASYSWPVDGGVIRDGFKATYSGRGRKHTGVDIMKRSGSKIYAAKSGRVVFSKRHSDYGHLVVIRHNNGLYTFYGHCSKRLVRAGDIVEKGKVIGKVGSTGRSSAPHLHFEIRKGSSFLGGYNSYRVFVLKPLNPLRRTFMRACKV